MSEPWWVQYEETAQRLEDAGDFHAADDIRTLVDGLRQYEFERGESPQQQDSGG